MTAINSNRAIRGPVTAVPVVAGKGVRLVADTDNNRWVIEADETVLWENSAGTSMAASTEFNLSDVLENYERVRFEFGRIARPSCSECRTTGNSSNIVLVTNTLANTSQMLVDIVELVETTSTKLTVNNVKRKTLADTSISTTTPTAPLMYKITGVNRIASN